MRRAGKIERFLPRAFKPSRAERLARKWTRMAVGLIFAALVTFVASPIALELSADALDRGRRALDDVRGPVAAGAPIYRDALHTNMPWTSANVLTDQGGIRFTARAIAAKSL